MINIRLDDDQLRLLANQIAARLQPPRWLSYEVASKYCSFGKSYLEKLVNAKRVVSKNVRLPGSNRGRRLIDRLSLDAFIEGSGDEPAQLVINSKEQTD